MDNPEHKFCISRQKSFVRFLISGVTQVFAEKTDDIINTYAREIYSTTEGKEMQ